MTFFSLKKPTIIIHPIKDAQIALLFTKKLKISAKYFDFSGLFLEKNAWVLLKLIKINQHFIKLKDGQQLLYSQFIARV